MRRSIVGCLHRARMGALDLAEGLASAYRLELVADWAPRQAIDIEIAGDLDRALTRSLDLADDFHRLYKLAVRGRNVDPHLADRTAAVHAITRDLDRARAYGRDLSLGRGFDPVAALRVLSQLLEKIESAADAATPTTLAAGLVRRATRLLPAEHRGRYSEEFRSELLELAGRVGRWRQAGYALRVLARTLPLRRALRVAAPEPADR